MVRLKKHNLILLLFIDIVVVHFNLYSQNSCKISDSLRYYFQRFANESQYSDFKQLNLFLSENELDKNSICYFPRDTSEYKILYQAIKKITISTTKDVNAIEFFFNYEQLSLRNVELAEGLMHLIPKIALQNTHGFLEALQRFNSVDRNKIIGNLEYLKGNDELKQLESNLKKIRNKKFKEIKQEVLNELEEIKH